MVAAQFSGMNCQKIISVGALFATVKNVIALVPEMTMTVSSPPPNRKEAKMPRTGLLDYEINLSTNL